MININGKILDQLDADEYFLFSILLNYGNKSHPCNDVLKKKTSWGVNRLQKAKNGLIDKDLIECNPRFKTVDGKSYRDSNEYVIKTKLASKYNGKKLQHIQSEPLQIEVVEIEVVQNEVLQFEVVQSEVLQNEVGKYVLKLSIIETIKLLKEKESKETPSQIELLKSELEKKEAEILELKIEKEKQRKKVALKKESSESYEGLSNFGIMDKRKENRNWTQLDTNFNGGFKMPKEWSDNLKNEVLGHWLYMDEKKGDRWGTSRTLSAQKDLITEWQKEFTELEIINALLDCQQRGNVTPNPLWTKNRKLKEDEQKQESQPIDHSLSFAERAMREKYGTDLFPNKQQNGNGTVDTQWYE